MSNIAREDGVRIVDSLFTTAFLRTGDRPFSANERVNTIRDIEVTIDRHLAPTLALMERLIVVVKGLDDIMNNSHGVDGWHKNGDIAEWGEFEEPELAAQALTDYEAWKKERGS